MPTQGLDPTGNPGNSTSMGGNDAAPEDDVSSGGKARKNNLKRRVDQEAGKLQGNMAEINQMMGSWRSVVSAHQLCDRCGEPTGGITKTVGNQEHCLTCVLEPTSPNTTYKEAGWKAVVAVKVRDGIGSY